MKRKSLIARKKAKKNKFLPKDSKILNYYKNFNNLILLDNNIDLLKKSKSINRCTLLLASSDYLPFKKSSFDSIVTSLVICSVNDVGKTFDELNRVLKPKGKYFFWEHTIIDNKIIYIIKSIFIFIIFKIRFDLIFRKI